jgi:uracil-DNA glycosylase family 4
LERKTVGKKAAKKILKFWGVKFVHEGMGQVEDRESDSSTSLSTVSSNLSTTEKVRLLKELDALIRQSEKCGLKKTATNLVFGEGNPDAHIFFVGEAPGFEEDKQGRPFVGRAGQLLTDIITKGIGIRREDVYIGNVLKCRPPENRTPTPEEIIACGPYLTRQLQIIHPKVIVALGASAVRGLLPEVQETISRTRGRFFDYHLDGPGANTGEVIKLMPTFHPAYLLRNPAEKAKVWDDIQKVMAYLGIPVPGKK